MSAVRGNSASPTHIVRPQEAAPPHRRGARQVLMYSPALVATVVCVTILRIYGTPVPVSLGFIAYLTVAIVLPGTLVWRRVRDQPVSLVEDLTMGAAIGQAAQALLGFALAPLGLSGWSWSWAPAVVLISALRPRWRRAWSRHGGRTTSSTAAWVQAAVVTAAAAWLGASSFVRDPVVYLDGAGMWSRAYASTAYVDLPFHHAIAAGVDKHFPLVYPYLYDEPLRYHLFVYEHLAGTSSASGIDLTWLLYRLDPLALVVLGILLTGVLARRLSGIPMSAPLATVVVTLSSSVSLYGWVLLPFQNPGLLHFATFRSPTQTFGVPLFLAALTATVVLLRGGARTRTLRSQLPLGVVFAALALAAGGSKSTFLPVLTCGLLLALAAGLWSREASWRRTALLALVTAMMFTFVTVVLLGGQSGSLQIYPLALLRAFTLTAATSDPTLTHHALIVLALTLAAWLATAAGGLLLAARRHRRDQALWLVVGCIIAGFTAALMTNANGLSQLYFLYAAWPLMGVLTAWGLGIAVRRDVRAGSVVVTLSLVVGSAIPITIAALDGTVVPAKVVPALPYRALLTPWASWTVSIATLTVVVWLLARRWPLPRLRPGLVAAVTAVCLISGSALAVRAQAMGAAVVDVTQTAIGARDSSTPIGPLLTDAGDLSHLAYVPIPHAGATATVYIRDHSAPDDVVATNAHCYGPPDACDSRHFWISALTERRVLVEGWAYPEGFRPGQTRTSPFWDTERYAKNEIVFTAPTAERVAQLADEFGVRWLLVDRTVYHESSDLSRYATLVHDSPEFAVYRIE